MFSVIIIVVISSVLLLLLFTVIVIVIICSIQREGHCSQARQVFVGCLQKEANKETATHKKGFSCKLLQNCPQVISPGSKLKRCSLSGKIKVMQSKCGVAQERLAKLQSELLCLSVEFAITVEIEALQSELKDQFHAFSVSRWKELNRQLGRWRELTKDNLWKGYWSWSWWWATSRSSSTSFL